MAGPEADLYPSLTRKRGNPNMTEPRSLAMGQDRWLTDSRVYNLIWLGRWLERAESIARTTAGATQRVPPGADAEGLEAALREVASTLGIPAEDCPDLTREILYANSVSSMLQSLNKARMNATQVAPVELVRAISEVILALEEREPSGAASAADVAEIAGAVMDGLATIGEEIESRWFGRESLTEEEVYHRFVQ